MRPHYTNISSLRLTKLFEENGLGLKDEVADLIYSLDPQAVMTIPQIVETVVPRSDKNFKRLTASLTRIVSAKGIQPIRRERVPPAKKHSRFFKCAHFKETLTDRSYYRSQMTAEGVDPREFISKRKAHLLVFKAGLITVLSMVMLVIIRQTLPDMEISDPKALEMMESTNILFESGKFLEAERDLQRLLPMTLSSKDRGSALLLLARTQIALGLFVQAQQSIKDSANYIDNLDQLAVQALVTLSLYQEDYTLALNYLSQAEPDDFPLLRAKVYVATGDVEKALSIITTHVGGTSGREQLKALILLGFLQAQSHNENAQQTIERAMRLQTDFGNDRDEHFLLLTLAVLGQDALLLKKVHLYAETNQDFELVSAIVRAQENGFFAFML